MKNKQRMGIILALLIVFLGSACSSRVTEPTTESRTVQAQSDEIVPTTQSDSSDEAAPSNSLAQPGKDGDRDHRTPPQEALQACLDLDEGTACEFISSKGQESGLCERVQDQLACSPNRQPGEEPGRGDQPAADQPLGRQTDQKDPPDTDQQGNNAAAAYNLEQALSDRAQGMTIAFDGLAFMTGSLGADSFFPPGKVADFWGFQYLRDNDPSQMGHNTDFLTKAAFNMLSILNQEQRAALKTLAESQVDMINEYGYKRFVLMDTMRRLLEGDLPAGTSGLDKDAVKAFSAELYQLDGEISYQRAQVMGGMLSELDESQKAALEALRGKGMLDWPDVEEPDDLRSLSRDVKVAVMTYAGDMFSWYLGSVEADVYFCPERHGTYFGSFYMKDAPAVGNAGYNIPTDLTGELGEAFLKTLTSEQAQQINALVEVQRPYLADIVDARKAVSTELRRFMQGDSADQAQVLALMAGYGTADGALVAAYAQAFSDVYQSLSEAQKDTLLQMRNQVLGELSYPDGAFLYSQPIPMPQIADTDRFFE